MEGEPPLISYPLGAVLWTLAAGALFALTPPGLRGQAVGFILFLLPLVMAILALAANTFTREGAPAAFHAPARVLVFALLFPFVLWGQWDAKRRKPR